MKRLFVRQRARTLIINAVLFVLTTMFYFAVGLVVVDVGGENTKPDSFVLVGATVVLAVALPRLRPQVERWINVLAFGKRANAYEVAASFSARVANTVGVEDVLPRLAEAAARSTHSRAAEVRVWLADGAQWRQTWPPRTNDTSTGVTVSVQHGGDTVGEISVDTLEGRADDGRQVLDALARPAGLAMSSVRLAFDLRHQLEQIEAVNNAIEDSQGRLIDAHRLERDRILTAVDREVEPHLASARQAIGVAGDMLKLGNTDIAPTMESGRAHATEALNALRRIARGVYPPLLEDSGVIAALRAWIELSGRNIRLEVNGPIEPVKLHHSIQAAIYFGCVTIIETLKLTSGQVTLDSLRSRVRFTVTANTEPQIHEEETSPTDIKTVVSLLEDRMETLGGSLLVDVTDEVIEVGGVLPLTHSPDDRKVTA